MEARSQNDDVLTEPHPGQKNRLIASPSRALPAINAVGVQHRNYQIQCH